MRKVLSVLDMVVDKNKDMIQDKDKERNSIVLQLIFQVFKEKNRNGVFQGT